MTIDKSIPMAKCGRSIPYLWHRRLAGASTGETPGTQNTGESPVPHRGNASAFPLGAPTSQCDSALVRRVNQLYHGLTQSQFDRAHARRFEVERPFWRQVARLTLSRHSQPRSVPMVNEPQRSRGRVVVDLACGTGFVTNAVLLADAAGPANRDGSG